MRLEGRVALITGGASGIGEAIARLFAREGAVVVVNDTNVKGAGKLAKEILLCGGKATVSGADVTSKTEIEATVRDILKEFGKLDILVNNAGVVRDALLGKMTEEEWDFVVDVNLKGTYVCCQAAAIPMMERKYGRITTTASISVLGNIGQANYAASKAGIVGLTKTLALELARHNILVNCVAPGFTETRMTMGLPRNIRDMFMNRIPLKRFASPEEIAKAHLFLVSDDANYITGQVLFVDGGISVGF